jgi:hypothetical protein
MPKAITQHYWGVQPITPAARPRREGQAQQLQDYVDAQKRAKRVQVLPRTEITEQEQTQALVECMDAWGYPLMWAAIIGVLVVMLVQNYGWWIVPGLVSVWGLRKVWGRLWGNAE